jgi:regulator of replication initiation timing
MSNNPEFSTEEILILIFENSLEEAKKREARLKRQISSMISEHRQLALEVQEMEEKLDTARTHFLNSRVPINEVV